ncbi:MAG: HAD-IIB family hydrolase [Sphingomonadaceae bacterium]|nr:HAD-IIB family hydrolase [Sphingomonadaceae bacterium]
MKKLIAFDLDGTLAESKQAIGNEMAFLLKSLLDVAMVSVISGGDWPQFEKQVVEQLPHGSRLDRLYIMPTTGSKLYQFQAGSWRQIYAENFSPEEHQRILDSLTKAVKACGFDHEQTWGEQIEDRGSQITFSALGQEAPLDAKKAWDPDISKRKQLQKELENDLSDLSVKVGGSTSIDITRKGVDKAYAVKRLCEYATVKPEEILFMGDAIYPGGNDDPVRAAGIDSVPVRDVQETCSVVRGVIDCLKP